MGFFQSLFGADSANRAANNAKNDLGSAFRYTEKAYAPYVDNGGLAQNAISNLNGLNGAAAQNTAGQMFHTDPGYQFKMDQGIQAIDRSAASKGGLMSGGTLKALNEYGQGIADQGYGDWYGRLAAQADTGANATGALSANKLSSAGAQGAYTAQIGANKTNAASGIAGLASGLLGGYLKK